MALGQADIVDGMSQDSSVHLGLQTASEAQMETLEFVICRQTGDSLTSFLASLMRPLLPVPGTTRAQEMPFSPCAKGVKLVAVCCDPSVSFTASLTILE